MNIQSKLRAADFLILGLLATFAGCANSPLHQSTLETPAAPIQVAALPDNVQAPVPVTTVAPQYPTAMRRAGVDGVVNVRCLVDETGRVKEARVTDSSDRTFDESALEAIWRWVFKPAQRDGVAVPMRVNVPVHFTIADM